MIGEDLEFCLAGDRDDKGSDMVSVSKIAEYNRRKESGTRWIEVQSHGGLNSEGEMVEVMHRYRCQTCTVVAMGDGQARQVDRRHSALT